MKLTFAEILIARKCQRLAANDMKIVWAYMKIFGMEDVPQYKKDAAIGLIQAYQERAASDYRVARRILCGFPMED